MKKRLTWDERCERMIPPGAAVGAEMLLLRVGILLSFVFSLSFFIRYAASHKKLFYVENGIRLLKDNAVMPEFAELREDIFTGFLIVALCQLILIGYHYACFSMGGSKSIYLMRRLPSRWELMRRVLSFPLIVIGICLLSATLLNLLYYLFYYLCTPEICRP